MAVVHTFFPVLLLLLLHYNGSNNASRITLVQRQACAYVSATKEVLCQCREEHRQATQVVRLQGFEDRAGQNVNIREGINPKKCR